MKKGFLRRIPGAGTLVGFMHWVFASLVSAFFLGCYELSTKHSVRANVVLAVLFFANVGSAIV